MFKLDRLYQFLEISAIMNVLVLGCYILGELKTRVEFFLTRHVSTTQIKQEIS